MSDFPFDAVLFDCDGVLVDSEPITNGVLAQMLAELGWTLKPDDCMRIFAGKTIRDEIPMIETHAGVRIEAGWIEQFQRRRNEALERELVEVAGAPEAVRLLNATVNGRIAVASGADRRKVELQLAKVGLTEMFEGRIFSGQDLPRSKPFPDVYLAAAMALDVPPSRCAVVEDTVTGAAAGVAAGATVFGYSPDSDGHSSADALREVGVALVFTDMADLPAVLAGWRDAAR